MTRPVDVDDPNTWPEAVCDVVSRWAEQCRGATEYTVDLPLKLGLEASFLELLAGHFLRGYHYTRLLPHEHAMIRNEGLRILSPDLLSNRIEAASTAGEISAHEAMVLSGAHVFASGEHQYREGQVCLVLSRRVFERDPDACLPLLTTWGGEGLYMSAGAVSHKNRLSELGSPVVVTALFKVGSTAPKSNVFPAIHKVFVGASLGLCDVGGDVFYRASIPSKDIERIDSVMLPTAQP
jgi:hypothetical protein